MPAEGHFNPLTGIAMHLKAAGHDVRWYAASKYIPKLERLGIPFYPFVRASEVDASNIGELYPERARLRGLALIRFDGNIFFVSDVGNHFEDVRDIDSKLIAPALEALKDTGALLVVTTGYGQTEALRAAYPQDHIIIEDFVDFDFILDRADLFICNGGYGSVLFSLSKGVPILGAGVQEGKNDVNAHVAYFNVGIDLRSERPKPADIRAAAQRLLTEPRFRQNVARLRNELNSYHPFEMIDAYLAQTNGRA
jgi:UDP:flavonoid glycosyltransferase YjiC (YdhE family)